MYWNNREILGELEEKVFNNNIRCIEIQDDGVNIYGALRLITT